MSRGGKLLTLALVALALLASLFLTLSWWLPRLAGFWLPATTSVALDGRPGWRDGGLFLPGIRYRVAECELAAASDVHLSRQEHRWRLHAGQVNVDSACFAKLPQSASQPGAPRSLAEWQAMLPAATIAVDRLSLSPWQNWAGSLRLDLARSQTLHWQGDNLALEAELRGQQLAIKSLRLNAPGLPQPVNVSGTLTLPKIPDALPDSGELAATLTVNQVPTALAARLRWQQAQGELVLTPQNDAKPLLSLPWRIGKEALTIEKGEWRWPYAAQPLSGGLSLSLAQWRNGLAATQITGRLNVLTQGRGGKGNVVLTVGPGHLDWQSSQLPFRLTGESKLAQLQFFAGIPGELNGPLLNPLLNLKPGALLRMRGRLLSTLEVDEARWPLSGVSLSSGGIDGRLQAILTAHDPQMGQFRLHLDGRANQFWPDRGEWLWRYWGEGLLAPLAAKWDVKGKGRWQNSLIALESLSTGFNQLSYGGVNVHAPRLTLAEPIRWRRENERPSFTGKLLLNAQQTTFASGGYLSPATLELTLKGRDPASFLFSGSLEAAPAGPIVVRGRWDGERLRGQAWWPQQGLTAFQSLLSDDLKMNIQHGTLRAQVAFSAADEGFTAGGHWVVSDGSVWLPDNQINGIDFSLPFRLAGDKWYFGAKGPVSLRIKEVKNQFTLQNVTADLQGSYPWSAARPLRLSNVSMDLLGGQVSLLSLQMPQQEAATLRLKNISMSELMTALKPKQIAMSGRINAALPLWLNNPQWLVKEGWIANSGPLTVRLDKDFADALSANNIAAGAALDWLRYMEISHSWARLDISNLGQLSLKAQVNGTSRFSDKNQRVSLNYTQQENLFQLWRSLRFGDNLQSWVEQHASLPANHGNQ